jgi:hypothetical protein
MTPEESRVRRFDSGDGEQGPSTIAQQKVRCFREVAKLLSAPKRIEVPAPARQPAS